MTKPAELYPWGKAYPPRNPSRRGPYRRTHGWGFRWADGSLSTRSFKTRAGALRVCRGKH